METKDKVDACLKSIALLGSAIAFGFTMMTWGQQNDIKRAEFLEQRIVEFERPSFQLAKRILDGFAVCDPCDKSVQKLTDEELLAIGSSRTGKPTDIQLSTLDDALNKDLQTTDQSKQRVRLSFDKLLDFFSKLEYYHDLDLMSDKEIHYFEYYIKKSAASSAIMTYAEQNSFDLFIAMVARKKMMTLKKSK